MELVENAANLAQENFGAYLVTLKGLRGTLKIGPVETKISINLSNIHNFTLYIVKNVLNGYLLKIFKKLNILPKVVSAKFFQLLGLKETFTLGISKIKNGREMQTLKSH